MSTRSERRRQERQVSGSPKKLSGGTIAVIVAVVAMIAIIAYAVFQRNAQVSGAAVSPIVYPSVPPPVKVGLPAPDFSIAGKGGVISSATLLGKPYLLEIFATWCPHCQRMTKVLLQLSKQFPPQRLQMVSVTGSPIGADSTADQSVPEDQADVDSFDAFYGVTWPSIADKDLSVAKIWGLNGFPTIFIVDARGKIMFQHSGEIDEKTLAAAAKKAGA
jgi:cytochrome c biogenesis protein CcmG/thiol:disulfide interchange protein DsbE